MRLAEEGIEELQHYVDTLIIIPNQNLFRVANEKTTFAQAFQLADNVLYSGVRGVTDLMVMPGLINLDFADVRQVMSEMGKAMMGTGEGEGDNRAIAAAEAAISNPLLDDVSMEGAKGVLINICGGLDMTLFEVDEAANRIRTEVDPDANIIFGSTFDEGLDGRMRISVIATGIDVEASAQAKPRMISLVQDNTRAREAARIATQGGPGLGIPPRAQAASPQPRTYIPGSAPAEGVLDLGTDTEQAPPAPANKPAAGVDPLAREIAARAYAGGIHADAEQPFLPPAPTAAPETPVVAAAPRRPDPMAEAELVNAGQAAPAPAPRRSLFSRVTAGTKALSRLGQDESVTPSKPDIEPRFAAQAPSRPAPAKAPPAAEAIPAAPAQPQAVSPAQPQAPAASQPALGGFEAQPPKDRDLQDDLLEIPAFLRRQAN
jgi:cell division protein FtsZ